MTLKGQDAKIFVEKMDAAVMTPERLEYLQSAAEASKKADGSAKAAVPLSPRRQEVVNLLFQGCSNKEIAKTMGISPGTVKRHLNYLFIQAGAWDRVGLICKLYEAKELKVQPQWNLTPRQSQIAILVARGLPNEDIAQQVGVTHGSVKNILRMVFDKVGAWSRLELALRIRVDGNPGYVTMHKPIGKPPHNSRGRAVTSGVQLP